MWKLGTSARLALSIVGFLSVLYAPWWAVVICIVLLSIFWRAGEVFFMGLSMDFIYSPVHTIPYFTIGAVLAVWLFEPLRREFLSS